MTQAHLKTYISSGVWGVVKIWSTWSHVLWAPTAIGRIPPPFFRSGVRLAPKKIGLTDWCMSPRITWLTKSVSACRIPWINLQGVSIHLIVRIALIALAYLSTTGILVPLPYSTRNSYPVCIHAESPHAKPIVYLTSPEPSKNCYNLFTLHPI